ncbi:MAG: GntR family transcriptional regulator [Clostridium sp.]
MEFDKNKPIYIQIIDFLKFKIASGELKPGEKLNSVRDMADDVDVNPNTMQRALAELEREGILYTQRTSGRFVCDDGEKIQKMRDELASREIGYLREILIKLGYTKEDILKVIEKNIKELR